MGHPHACKSKSARSRRSTKTSALLFAGILALGLIGLLGVADAGGQQASQQAASSSGSQSSSVHDPGPRAGAASAGEPLSSLSASDSHIFSIAKLDSSPSIPSAAARPTNLASDSVPATTPTAAAAAIRSPESAVRAPSVNPQLAVATDNGVRSRNRAVRAPA